MGLSRSSRNELEFQTKHLVYAGPSGVPLYVTWSLSFATLNIFSLIQLLFLLLCAKGNFCSDLVSLVLCASYTLIGISFFRLGKFSSMILLKIFSVS